MVSRYKNDKVLSKQVLKQNTAANYQEGRKGEIVFRL